MMVGGDAAYHWQVMVLPVFIAAEFPTVSPMATFCGHPVILFCLLKKAVSYKVIDNSMT
jgi:hypothetical protein